MALPKVRSVSAAKSVNTTSLALTRPTGFATGDLLVAFIVGVGSTTTYPVITPPAGWTTLDTGDASAGLAAQDNRRRIGVYWRVVQAGDSEPTWTFDLAGYHLGEIVCVRDGQVGSWSVSVGADGSSVAQANPNAAQTHGLLLGCGVLATAGNSTLENQMTQPLLSSRNAGSSEAATILGLGAQKHVIAGSVFLGTPPNWNSWSQGSDKGGSLSYGVLIEPTAAPTQTLGAQPSNQGVSRRLYRSRFAAGIVVQGAAASPFSYGVGVSGFSTVWGEGCAIDQDAVSLMEALDLGQHVQQPTLRGRVQGRQQSGMASVRFDAAMSAHHGTGINHDLYIVVNYTDPTGRGWTNRRCRIEVGATNNALHKTMTGSLIVHVPAGTDIRGGIGYEKRSSAEVFQFDANDWASLSMMEL